MGQIVGLVFPETEPEQDAAEIPAETEPEQDAAEIPAETEPEQDAAEIPAETEPEQEKPKKRRGEADAELR